MIEIQFRFFGAMREFGAGMSLAVPAGLSVRELKERLGAALAASHPAFRPGLLAQSAVGDARAVLAETDRVEQAGELAVLPPVCGG